MEAEEVVFEEIGEGEELLLAVRKGAGLSRFEVLLQLAANLERTRDVRRASRSLITADKVHE